MEKQEPSMGFREWTEHYEKEQDTQREQISELTKNVSSLSSDVRTLVENQRGFHSRLSRPVAPVMIAAFAVLISMSSAFAGILALTIKPIKDSLSHMESSILREDERNLDLHQWIVDSDTQSAIRIAKLEENARWVEKLEDRYNSRIHTGIGKGD
jgi:hypothetical protein